MRNPNLFVLSTTHPISDEQHMLLALTAQNLYREKRGSQRFKGRTCEGMVETQFKFGCLGTEWGIIFKANVDTFSRSFVTRYIISAEHLEVIAEERGVIADLFPKGSLQELDDAVGIN